MLQRVTAADKLICTDNFTKKKQKKQKTVKHNPSWQQMVSTCCHKTQEISEKILQTCFDSKVKKA